MKVSAQKWRKDEFGVFKYMKTQTTKYICPGQNRTDVVTENSTGVNISQRKSDYDENFPGSDLGLDNISEGSVECLKEKVSED